MVGHHITMSGHDSIASRLNPRVFRGHTKIRLDNVDLRILANHECILFSIHRDRIIIKLGIFINLNRMSNLRKINTCIELLFIYNCRVLS